MADFLSREERSNRMSRIRSRDTAPELALRKALHAMGFRYRVDDRRLPGRPDLVFPRYRTIVFVHGCFWHRHPGCNIATTPKSNTEFWTAKFDRNVARDELARAQRASQGWQVIIAWECELSSGRRVAASAKKIARLLREGRGGHTW